MCSLERFKIDLKSLKDDVTSLELDLDDAFFGALDGAEIEHGALHVSVSIRKASGFFELRFHTSGTVTVVCDRCLDDMEQPIEAGHRLIAKFGTAYSEDDDTVTVDENEGILDIAWFIYESVSLAIPIKHVHAPGKCNPAMTEVLEELSVDRSNDEASSPATDPRWEKLRELSIK